MRYPLFRRSYRCDGSGVQQSLPFVPSREGKEASLINLLLNPKGWFNNHVFSSLLFSSLLFSSLPARERSVESEAPLLPTPLPTERRFRTKYLPSARSTFLRHEVPSFGTKYRTEGSYRRYRRYRSSRQYQRSSAHGQPLFADDALPLRGTALCNPP